MSDTTSGAVAPEQDERLAYRSIFQRLLIRPEIGAAIGAVAIWIMFWAVSVPFGKAGGASSILDVASSPLGIMAVAVAMLMIGGEFDLSSGAATGALGILTILLVRDVAGDVAGAGLNLWWALLISLAAALGLGWFNGTMVNKTSLPSFIVTLASFFIIKGGKLGFSKLIVSQIQVGKLNDLEIYAAENDVSDKGYGILRAIFAADWPRNEHVWESRDVVYLAGAFVGVCLLVLALCEMHFTRRDNVKSTGAAPFLGGLALVGIGIWRLHATDGVSGNVLGSVLIGVGTLVGLMGWCAMRYLGRTERGSSLSLSSASARSLGLGVVSLGASIAIALWFDSQNGDNLVEAFGLGKGSVFFISLLAAACAGGVAFVRRGALSALPIDVSVMTYLGTAAGLGFGIAMTFCNMATEQGARAIFFISLAVIGAVFLLMAVHQARRTSSSAAVALQMVTALAVVGVAFFIRSESLTPKFRTQAFSFMLVIALLMAVWGILAIFFQNREASDATADRLGTIIGVAGVAAIVVSLVARLLWVTEAELAAGIPPAKFSVRILWFVAVTAVATWVLGRTKFGSWTFAVGGNKVAARQVGVPAARTKTQLFMIVSVAAWLVGLLLAFRLNTIQASTGDGEEFEYIIAAVVGGTALTGGYGSTLGAAIGAIIMAMAVQGIPSSRWNSDWRFVFLGGILLLAVIANNFIRSKAEAAR